LKKDGGPVNRPARCLLLGGFEELKKADGPSAMTAAITSGAWARDGSGDDAAENPPDDAGDSVLPARARVLKPCGKPYNRNTWAIVSSGHKTARSSLDAGSLESRNLRELLQSADPRAFRRGLARRAVVLKRVGRGRPLAQLPLPAIRPAAATGSTADNAGSGRGGVPCPVHCSATAQRPATTATSLPHDGTCRCKIDCADGLAERIARIL
jgi:hypothetical protein